MLRYKHLLQKTLDPKNEKAPSLRELAKAIGLHVPSLHNYVEFDTLPRIENASKLATYYGESISSLFSEDDDTTAALVQSARQLPTSRKKKLLKELSKESQ